MKLTVVIHSLDAGGTQRFLSNLAAGLVDRGVDVGVVTLSLADVDDFFAMPRSVQRHRLSLDRSHGGALLGRVRRDVASLHQLRRVISDADPDLVLSLGWSTNVITLVSTRLLGRAVVVSERVDPRDNATGKWWAKAQRLVYPFATHLVTQTAGVEQHMRRWVRRGRISTIPNPVPTALFDVGVEPAAHPHVVAVCRLTSQKGVDVLLRAFAIVRTSHPTARLSIVGDGPDRDDLEGLAAELTIADAVTFHGMLDQPAAVTRTGWVGCLASRNEGFPNALVEMMAIGLACVSTDCRSGPAELFEGGCGRLVPVDDVARLAATLDSLLADPAARAALAERAQSRAREFEQERVIDDWHRLLRGFARR